MTLLFVGDVMLGRLVNAALQEQSPAYPWGDTLALFQQADVHFCFPVAKQGEVRPNWEYLLASLCYNGCVAWGSIKGK